MCSVDDTAKMNCPACKKETVHETNWDAEAPKDLFVTCTECKKSRTIHT